MKIFQYIMVLILFFPVMGLGQNDFNWENKIPIMAEIPDTLSHEDAVVISASEHRKISTEKSYINTAITLRKKIKILTKKGIQEHSFFRIKQSPDMTIEVLDARTIKPNGVILDFESSEIKSIETKSQIAGKSKDLFFAIPGIDVGDEVEMICKYHCKNFQSNDFIYFHQSIPVLKSTFSINAPKKVIVKSNVYGGLELPTVRYNMNTNIVTWSSENNKKSMLESDSNLYDKPHLIYQLDYQNLIRQGDNSSFNNWYHLISYFEKTVFKPKIRDKKKFDRYWKEISKSETDPMILLQNIHDFLNHNIAISPLHPYERSKGVTYFLENKKASPIALMKIYFALLKRANLKTKIAVGQSKNIGPIDLKIPSIVQISNFLLVVEYDDKIVLLTPKEDENSYKLHQLPKFLYGTDIYMMSSKKRKKLMKITIPEQAY